MNLLELILHNVTYDFTATSATGFRKKPKVSWLRKILQRGVLLWNFVGVFLVCMYLMLVLWWAIFGALLNPTIFLPYATGAITVVTFVAAKQNELKSSTREVRKKVRAELDAALFKNTLGFSFKQLLSDPRRSAKALVAQHTADLVERTPAGNALCSSWATLVHRVGL